MVGHDGDALSFEFGGKIWRIALPVEDEGKSGQQWIGGQRLGVGAAELGPEAVARCFGAARRSDRDCGIPFCYLLPAHGKRLKTLCVGKIYVAMAARRQSERTVAPIGGNITFAHGSSTP